MITIFPWSEAPEIASVHRFGAAVLHLNISQQFLNILLLSMPEDSASRLNSKEKKDLNGSNFPIILFIQSILS